VPVPGTTLTSLRPLIQGTNGVVVSSHPAAAMAGLDILRRGGNAIDAGVAVGLALNVVHAHECNFLGVAPTIMYLADRLSGLFSAATSRQTPGWHFTGSDPGSCRRVVHCSGPVWHHALCRCRGGGHQPCRQWFPHVSLSRRRRPELPRNVYALAGQCRRLSAAGASAQGW
jgi:hypothetical protein